MFGELWLDSFGRGCDENRDEVNSIPEAAAFGLYTNDGDAAGRWFRSEIALLADIHPMVLDERQVWLKCTKQIETVS